MATGQHRIDAIRGVKEPALVRHPSPHRIAMGRLDAIAIIGDLKTERRLTGRFQSRPPQDFGRMARNRFHTELIEAARGERFQAPRQTKKVDSQNAISYNGWNFHKGR
jgi:hypothetical protein